MARTIQSIVTVVGRIMIVAIFLGAAVANKIPHFDEVAQVMTSVGIPSPRPMLVGAIVFLITGSLSLILGDKARIGAALLLTFLALATYYFHNFWDTQDAQAKMQQMIQFQKNLSMMGRCSSSSPTAPAR
jgi:putative oxidoreductase